MPGHEAKGSRIVGPTFKTGVPAKAGRRVRFPSASATSSAFRRLLLSDVQWIAVGAFLSGPLPPGT
jgi:hypothetical protein